MKRTVSDEAKDASKRGGGREERKQKWNILVAGYKVPLTFAQYSTRFNQVFTCNITMTFHLELSQKPNSKYRSSAVIEGIIVQGKYITSMYM